MALIGIILFFITTGSLGQNIPRETIQVEESRAKVTNSIHFLATDLLDDLVYDWMQTPPLNTETRVLLRRISVPFGFSSDLQPLVEDHLHRLLIQNPSTHLVPIGCQTCRTVAAIATPDGVLIGQGVHNEQHDHQDTHYELAADFEVDGPHLILRSWITDNSLQQRVLYTKTLIASQDKPSSLRSYHHLKSSTQAREEYIRILRGQRSFLIQPRFQIRIFHESITPIPVPSIELSWQQWTSEQRQWQLDFHLEGTPYSIGSGLHILSLISSSSPSLIKPNLFAKTGLGYTISFQEFAQSLQQQQEPSQKGGGSYTYTTLTLGVEAQWPSLMTAFFALERIPELRSHSTVLTNITHSWSFGIGALI